MDSDSRDKVSPLMSRVQLELGTGIIAATSSSLLLAVNVRKYFDPAGWVRSSYSIF